MIGDDEMSSDGMVYIAYQWDISGTQWWSGVYTNFDQCLEVLREQKRDEDALVDRLNSRYVSDHGYDGFGIVRQALDCETEGETVYKVQGETVIVDLMTSITTGNSHDR